MTFRQVSVRLAVTVAAAAGLMIPVASAQESSTLYLGDGPKWETATDIKKVLLRPNSDVPLFAFVRNKAPGAQTFTAELRNADGAVIAQGTANVDGGKTLRIPLAGPKGIDKPAPYSGSQIKLRLLDAQNAKVYEGDVHLSFQSPTDYAGAEAEFTGSVEGENKFKVTVTVNSKVPGGPVKAKVDFTKVAGLIQSSLKDAGLSGEALPLPEKQIVLIARNLRFNGAPTPQSVVAVTVDGYERAFLFETAFKGNVPLRPREDNRMTIVARPFSPPTDKFHVKIEVAQPKQSGAYIQFLFDKANSGVPESKFMSDDRERTVTSFVDAATGALIFNDKVKDWEFDQDATDVTGPRTLKAVLREAKNREDRDPEKDPKLNSAETQVMFDDSPPAVKVSASPELLKGDPLKVTVTASDAESGVDRVLVFFDTPAPEVKAPVPGKVWPAQRTGGKNSTTFVAKLPAREIKGAIAVGARAFNGAGLTADAPPVDIVVVDAPAVGTGTPAKIKVVVGQGEPLRPQKAKPVYLIDQKTPTTVFKTGETNDKGEYTFKDVPPGSYVVRSDDAKDHLTAKKSVSVEAGKTSEVELELKRTRTK